MSARVATVRDPRGLARAVVAPAPDERVVLALDLGTNTGYAYAVIRPGAPLAPVLPGVVMGQWDLSAGQYDSGAVRFVRLRHFLAAIRPDLVAYERVRNTPVAAAAGMRSVAQIAARITPAAQFFGGLQATVAAWCEARGVACQGVEIAEIKRRATGKGNAAKEDVIRAANATFGTSFDATTYEQTGVDNVCDAAYCLLVALEGLADGLDGEDSVHAARRARRVPAGRRGSGPADPD